MKLQALFARKFLRSQTKLTVKFTFLKREGQNATHELDVALVSKLAR
jgi:hypothetical protein